jgi:hypothetical protein
MRLHAIPMSPPSSRRGGAEPESESFGRVHRMVKWLDANKGSFFISALIMQTGINLRAYGLGTVDDGRVIARLWPVLDTMLSPEEREALLRALRDGPA